MLDKDNISNHHKLIVWFKEVGKEDVALAGGKGANLGEMVQAGFPVPNGFILTSEAYYYFIKENQLALKIENELKKTDRRRPDQLFQTSKRIRALIRQADFPKDLAKLVFRFYAKLQGPFKEPLVAVRSSATAEDLPDASFAGQQETYLNVKGEANLIEKIKEGYGSLFTPRAIFYREEKNFDHFKIGIAIPVQLMVESDTSGVMFTVDPVTNNKSVMVIEAVWGLGELIVQGSVTPDQYLVDKKNWEIIKKTNHPQKQQLSLSQEKNRLVRVPALKQNRFKLSDQQVNEVAVLGKKIHQHYFFPQDIEWAYVKNKLFLLQTRPITTLNKTEEVAKVKDINLKLLIQGQGASPGLVSGYTVKIGSPKEIGKVQKGDIMVTSMTSPDYVPAMKKAGGIITDKGGLTSHAAIVSRELGVPCVVGTKTGSTLIKDHTVVTINGSTGEVFSGGLEQSAIDAGQDAANDQSAKRIVTATKLYVNLADPDTAEKIAGTDIDGVGLLRAEFIMAQLKDHPKKIIREGRQSSYINKLSQAIATFCRAFDPRPVIYRTADFKTNEYSHLTDGQKYEPKEENPLLGFRGATRYIMDEPVFNLELKAILRVRKQLNLHNLWLMLPFVRTVEDLKEVKKIMHTHVISRSSSFKLFLMCEIPSNVIMLEDFIKAGIDGVSIGSNDLTMLTLGVDRDNEVLASRYTETDPAVLKTLELIVTTCRKNDIYCSICGEAPSNHADLVKDLVKWGITSISVSPDRVEKTRLLIAQAEHELVSRL
jgi:pyruvate,water dikinase